MRSPLVYLTAVKLKNQIKEAVKHPAKLIYILFLAAMLVLATIGGSANQQAISLRPLSELTSIMVLFYTFTALMTFLNGVNGGAGNYPMFTLSDVSMLFPSPLKPNKVLFYGLFRQLGLSLLLGLFLLFQYSWMHAAYGLNYGHLLLIVLGYALSLFLGQVCAMAAYTRTSGNDNARRILKYFVYGVSAGFVVWMLTACMPQITQGDHSEGLFSFAMFGVLEAGVEFLSTIGIFFPVSGWSAGLIGNLFTGNYLLSGVCALLMLVVFGFMLLLVVKNKNNYYEDVLQTAEMAQSAITAKKEGQPAEVVPKKVRVGKTGLNKGSGSSSLFYKHLLENRRSGVFVFSKMTMIFMLVIIGCSVIYSMMFSGEEENTGAFVAVFTMSTYMQMFSEGMGRFSWEISKPYIYMIPEPPFKKLLWATAETLLADCLEAVCIFIPVGMILGISPLDTLLCIIARISFALLFTAGNIMVERIFGTVRSKGLMLVFYFVALLVLAAPGVGLGILLMATELLPGAVGVLLGIIVANVPIALVVMFLCRNLLQYAELNGK